MVQPNNADANVARAKYNTTLAGRSSIETRENGSVDKEVGVFLFEAGGSNLAVPQGLVLADGNLKMPQSMDEVGVAGGCSGEGITCFNIHDVLRNEDECLPNQVESVQDHGKIVFVEP